MRRALAVAALLGALAGCSGPAATAPAPAAPPASRLPDRPAELPLDGVDPCALLTPAQLGRFGLSSRTNSSSQSDSLGSPDCMWESTSRGVAESYLTRLIVKRAADYYLDNQNPVKVIDVGGYAAVQTTSPIRPSDQDHCLVLVDLAAGQTLWTQYDALLGDNPGITQQESRARARDGAQAMVSTLKALRKQAN